MPPARVGWRGYARGSVAGLITVSVLIFACWLLFQLANPNEPGAAPLRLLLWLATLAPPLVWAIGVLVPLWRRYLHAETVLTRPYILFLRRFSTFADRAIVTLVLRAARSDTPVVFLTATRSQAGDWNPFVVGFAGFKVRHPIRSMPLVLQVADAEWPAAAAHLIEHATLIVIDISESSDAMTVEMVMIGTHFRWPATVCLHLHSAARSHDWTVPPEATVIDYHKSWRQALPKLLAGVLFAYVSGTMFLMVLAGLLVLMGAETDSMVQTVILLSLVLIIIVSSYVAVFAIPTIDRPARVALRAAFRRLGKL
jgi:hypothetical protein